MRICLVRTIDIMKFTSENLATQFKTQNKYFRHGIYSVERDKFCRQKKTMLSKIIFSK